MAPFVEQTTLRSLAAEVDLTTDGLLELLEMTPEHHDVDAALTPRVESLCRMILASQPVCGR